MARVMPGDGSALSGCINDTVAALEAAFRADGTPYAVTMERVLRGGVGALAGL